MMKTYEEELILRTCHCDFQGQWRPSAILESMQEAAGAHSHLLGLGRDALLEKNMIWVLSRSEVQMEMYPGVGDRVRILTFPMPNRRWFFPRFFLFYSDDGKVLGKASTLWVLLDPVTRKIVPPGEAAARIPDNSDLTAPMGMPATVEAVAGEERVLRRLPCYTDLDVNGHVNNTRYADWACDALGIEVMKEYCLGSLAVNYHAEVLPGQEISVQVSCQDGRYRVAGYHEEKLHFELGGSLCKRKA